MPYYDEEVVANVDHLLDTNETYPRTAMEIVAALAKSYTRGRGFDTDGTAAEDIAAVITTAAARLAANSRQLNVDQSAGPFSQSLRNAFTGWTLAEQYVLNRYRKRAM